MSQTGKPIYCGDCKVRLTRKNRASLNGAPGFDDMCVKCYDKAGLENEHTDGLHEPGEFPQDCPLCEKHLEETRSKQRKDQNKGKTGESIAKGIPRDTKGLDASKAKARALLATAEELGWSLKDFETEEETGTFYLNLHNENTGEEISAFWSDGVWQHPCMYRYSGRELKLNNASAARKRMASEPDLVIRKTRSVSPGEDVGEEGAGRIVAYRVPFDPINGSDAEIFSAVYGRKLVWRNMLSGLLEEATVTGRKTLRITYSETSGKRILHFVDNTMTGYRAIHLENLVQVV